MPVDRLVGHKGCPEVAQVGFRDAGEDRAETGDADDDADEPRRAGKAGGHAGALGRHRADLRFCRLAVQQPSARPGYEHADRGRPIGEVNEDGGCRDGVADRDQAEAETQDRSARHACCKPAADARTDQQRHGEGRHGKAGDRRRKNEGILQIERQDRHHDLSSRCITEHRDRGADNGRIAKDRQVDHGALMPAFGEDEGDQQDRADDEAQDRARALPALLGRASGRRSGA